MNEEHYVSEKRVSCVTGIAVQTLRNHRALNRGIPYVKVGRSVATRFVMCTRSWKAGKFRPRMCVQEADCHTERTLKHGGSI